ncbi:MAG: flagellar hook-associated protein FlgK [Devosia nanyangense]|uniref:Flagellar hook-associated protein 1 n=1 Tax=Devosia nanyangense TaxID=1228055 RepID=A0A933KZZ8_9HYPH|nr:flagellar hook-associated protein FlgK [Devosia nanyangense]
MGLSASLNNALSGMGTSQSSLDVLSRNVANAGTPGYHKQSLSVIDTKGVNSIFARSGGIERAFNRSLQAYYTTATSNAGYASLRAEVLDRLQSYLGKPGDAGSLDAMFTSLQSSLQALGTSPDNYATRATVVSQAQEMAATLNALSQGVQGLRQETETQMASSVQALNQAISSLAEINARLGDQTADAASRSALLDQRDRLVSQISEQIDVRVDYRTDDTVALMTRTGIGILDGKASTFEFQSGGTLTAEKQFNVDADKSGVGRLMLVTSSGLSIDLVKQDVLQSGKLAALIELRDTTLVTAQNQLDEIAAGLAQAFSTVTTVGTPASSGAQNGFSLDLSAIQDGNDFVLNYTKAGIDKTLRVVRVDDPTKLPLDYLDANGVRVVGMSFAGGAISIASALGSVLGSGFSVSGSGSTLTVLDDGATGTTDIGALTARTTATGLQNGDPALSLFVDRNNSDYTGSLGGRGEKLGFASRIAVNAAILTDNKLLVQYQAGGSLGDSARADYLLEQLQSMTFASGQTGTSGANGFRLGGTIADLIAQAMDYTGSVAASATSQDDTQQLTMDSLTQRLDGEYGVNVDEEMARLMELQNAYAANARVISIVQDLMDRLLQI